MLPFKRLRYAKKARNTVGNGRFIELILGPPAEPRQAVFFHWKDGDNAYAQQLLCAKNSASPVAVPTDPEEEDVLAWQVPYVERGLCRAYTEIFILKALRSHFVRVFRWGS